MKNKKVLIICGILLVVLVAAAAIIMAATSAKTEAGSKTITFELIDKDGKSESFEISTDAEFLADALVEKGLITYDEAGLYSTINGITADWNADQGWWNISKSGEALAVGMNEQPIADGEHYEATYTIGF